MVVVELNYYKFGIFDDPEYVVEEIHEDRVFA